MSRHTPSRVLSALAAVVAGTLIATVAGAPALAQAPQEQAGSVPTMIVLDASSSMLESDAPGPRIDAAKAAATALVESLPQDAVVGLQAYGTGTGDSDAERSEGCQDVKTLVPVGPLDRNALTSQIAGITASGYTPIGTALREAAGALPADGERAIVLVSDGIDVCAPPPPCEVAEELAAQGVDLTIHTVGFKVDPAARADLECIARATGGTYSDAGDASELESALETKVTYAIEGYQIEGTPIEGVTSETDPAIATLTPGQWRDTVDTSGNTRNTSESTVYYALDPREDWTQYVTATAAFPTGVAIDGGFSSLRLTVTSADGERCGEETGIRSTAGSSTELLNAAVVASCPDPALVAVTFGGDKYLASTDVELISRLEPPSDLSGVPAPETRPVTAPQQSAEVLPLTGGTSFNTATEVSAGQTYDTQVVSGEIRYYKVPVEWGQQVTFSAQAESIDGDGTFIVETAEVEIFDPMRNQRLREYAQWQGVDAEPLTGGTPEPVRATSDTFALNGFWYVALRLTPNTDPLAWTIRLTVDTPGEVEEGPVYLIPTETPTPSAAADGTDAGADAEPTDRTAASGATPWPWIIAGAGGLVVAALVVGFVLLRRRRARDAAS